MRAVTFLNICNSITSYLVFLTMKVAILLWWMHLVPILNHDYSYCLVTALPLGSKSPFYLRAYNSNYGVFIVQYRCMEHSLIAVSSLMIHIAHSWIYYLLKVIIRTHRNFWLFLSRDDSFDFLSAPIFFKTFLLSILKYSSIQWLNSFMLYLQTLPELAVSSYL